MAREFFCAYHSYLSSMELLNDEERGRLFTALLIYSESGKVPTLTGNERFVFPAMRDQIDRDNKKYAAKCEKNRENVLKRHTNEYERKQSYTNATKEKEKEKTKEKEKEKDKEKESIRVIGEKTSPADKPPRSRFVPPDETQAIAFFRENGSNKTEAQTFLDYYQANGWKISGKTPMKDWQAAARNWIRRAGQYSKPQANQQPQQKAARDVLSDAVDMIENGDFSFMEV